MIYYERVIILEGEWTTKRWDDRLPLVSELVNSMYVCAALVIITGHGFGLGQSCRPNNNTKHKTYFILIGAHSNGHF